MTILDIHTHHPVPQPEAIVDASPLIAGQEGEFIPMQGQLYSVGIHPWDTIDSPSETLLNAVEKAALLKEIVAIGECGVDLLKGGPMFRQLQVFRRMADLSERLKKPLIVHDVKAHDIICGLRRDLRPVQPWVIHGFRGNAPTVAMLLRSGCRISFGEKFNSEALRSMPADKILAETDESPFPINEIIRRMSEARGEDLTAVIAANSKIFCNFES